MTSKTVGPGPVGKKRRKRRPYVVISTPRAAGRSGQAAPSGGAAVPRLRTPSAEPTLEAEWVRERTSRVIPAVGTGGGDKGVSSSRAEPLPVTADLNRPRGADSDLMMESLKLQSH